MSKLLTLRVALALTVLMVGVFISHAQERPPQQLAANANHIVSDEIYEQVLDIVFPKDALVGAFGYAFVLRYKTSFDGESQIIVLNNGSSIEVTEYSPSGSSVYAQLSKSPKFTENTNAVEAAKLVQVQKRTLLISSADIKRLRVSFYDHLRDVSLYERTRVTENRNAISITTDGTEYFLWYRGVAKIAFSSSGSSIEDPPRASEHPLVKWMKEVRRVANYPRKRVPGRRNRA